MTDGESAAVMWREKPALRGSERVIAGVLNFFLGLALLIVLMLWTNSAASGPRTEPVGLFVGIAVLCAASTVVVDHNSYGDGYLATLWATLPFLPAVAAVSIVLTYLGTPEAAPLHHEAVLFGLVVAAGMWVWSAGPLHRLASADIAQARSFEELRDRTRALRNLIEATAVTRRPHPGAGAPPDPGSAGDPNGETELELLSGSESRRPVLGQLDILEHELGIRGAPGSGLRFVSGTGYINLWRTLHRAEEELIDVEVSDSVIADAVHENLRLNGANITNAGDLQALLRSAVDELDPPATKKYLPGASTESDGSRKAAPVRDNEPQVSLNVTTGEAAASNEAAVTSPKAGLGIALATMGRRTSAAVFVRAQSRVDDSGSNSEPDSARTARHVVREVRHAINEYRDNRWEGLVRQRNRLLRTVLLTSTGVLLLVGLAVVSGIGSGSMAVGSAYFLVAASVGLFSRLRGEGAAESAVDDYGLFEAQLLHAPLLSGLAGVAGVVLAKVAVEGAGNLATIDLGSVFTLSALGLISAATFGLTPQLLIDRLGQEASKLKGDLKATEAGDGQSCAPV